MPVMDAVSKLELFANYMSFEPAEEHTARQPVLSTATTVENQQHMGVPPSAHLRAPCGNSPAELQRMASEGSTARPSTTAAKKNALGISYAAMPGGKRIALLKTLLTSACERNCYYCPFRAGRDFKRATFKPEEMAKVFMELHSTNVAEGFFLSSGIAGGGMRTQDNLIDTADILRRKLGYRGYLHLKIMPGADRDQVAHMMKLADRVSINLEAPNALRLKTLAPGKQFLEELLRPLQWVEEIRRASPSYNGWNGRWPSTVTQLVVGGADESDLEIMSVSAEMYKRLRLSRVYYSAFHPVTDTPLENRPAESPLREFRLYQSSFLLRDYGFDLEDLPFAQSGNLPLETDPKIAWAQVNLSEAPIEINKADRQQLLRVPGIGPKGVDLLLVARRKNHVRNLRDLQRIGVLANRAAPFVLIDGRRPPHQLHLWQ
jgi:predicted DNA-binding helix-hairpin-helix protein